MSRDAETSSLPERCNRCACDMAEGEIHVAAESVGGAGCLGIAVILTREGDVVTGRVGFPLGGTVYRAVRLTRG